jgi:hypothetical protein
MDFARRRKNEAERRQADDEGSVELSSEAMKTTSTRKRGTRETGDEDSGKGRRQAARTGWW